MASLGKLGRTLRSLALATCSVGALAGASASAQTTTGNTVQPFYGTISPFYGTISPFYGTISPFYGKISPFYGPLSPFYGTISPFYGTISPFYGKISPFWGKISPFTATTDAGLLALYGTNNDPFWGSGDANPYTKNPGKVVYSQISGFWSTEGTSWGAVMQAWSSAQTAADYQALAAQIQTTILNPASSFWAGAIPAPKPVPGAPPAPKTAQAGFNNLVGGIFQNAGVKLNSDGTVDPNSLAAVSQTQQAMLFLNLYDNLMAYSGTGHVDWWMGATGWSPNLASIVGSVYKADYPVTIGMIDFSVSATGANAKGSLTQYGSDVFSNGHGAAVGSLIMGSVDGSGVMGIMPAADAKVVVYNPYDSTGTTNWTDVGKGIDALTANIFTSRKSGAPVGVINASLGVPGWTLNPGWNDALNGTSGLSHMHNLVIAAGNEGVQQTTDVAWNFARNPTLIVVGSVGLDGTISNFSNTPGETCLVDTTTGVCDKLKNHFIVAPGELILVSDGNGGVTRQSGTSLAAPLVSGAIALLQARWPWLGYYPNETAQIILKSATPLGTNPGADPVYGVGELNIAASQSPLNWNAVSYTSVVNGKATPVPISQVVTQIQTGSQTTWNNQKLYYVALEQVGNTHRDFQIPLAASLVGQLVTTEAGQQQFQSYLSAGLQSWAAGGGHFAGTAAGAPGMIGFMQSSAPVGRIGGMDVRLKMAPAEVTYGFRPTNLPLKTEFAVIGKTQTLRFGYGDGATVLGGQYGFSQSGDYRIDRGGANPLLGLASGGAFVDWRMAMNSRWAVNFGVTDRRSVRDVAVFGPAIQATPGSVYEASATHLGVDYTASERLVLHSALTRLHENTGLLGVQSLQQDALRNGSTTDGVTLGFDAALTPTLTLSGSGTVAKTTAGAGQSLTTGPGGLTSTAAEVALTKVGVFTAGDRVRMTVSQPMRVSSGGVHYTTYGVVDRQTGALGLIEENVGVAASGTPVAAEMLYGRPILHGAGEFGLFGRAETHGVDLQGRTAPVVIGGAKFKFVF